VRCPGTWDSAGCGTSYRRWPDVRSRSTDRDDHPAPPCATTMASITCGAGRRDAIHAAPGSCCHKHEGCRPPQGWPSHPFTRLLECFASLDVETTSDSRGWRQLAGAGATDADRPSYQPAWRDRARAEWCEDRRQPRAGALRSCAEACRRNALGDAGRLRRFGHSRPRDLRGDGTSARSCSPCPETGRSSASSSASTRAGSQAAWDSMEHPVATTLPCRI